MNIVVFSKDRGCQLELFLRSMEKQFVQFSDEIIKIIYTYSSDDFYYGYQKTQQTFSDCKNIRWIKEVDFKDDLIRSIFPEDPLTVFFTDDDVWINEFSQEDSRFLNFSKSNDIACFSLRLNPYIDYSYVNDKPLLQKPSFDSNGVFKYIGLGSYFGYSMSVDGHIFKTPDILPLIEKLSYKNPNEFEAQLSQHPINKPNMACLEKSAIVNNPCNLVQNTFKNRNEGMDSSSINTTYLSGLRLSLDGITGINPKCPHQPLPLNFQKFVSVIIPSFDRYDWLMHSIDSVNKQTYGNFEILVINDMSSDDRYDKTNWKSLNVRYQKTDNLSFGSVVARNIGLSKARFEWIAMLDDDDMWHPDKLKIQIKEMGEYLISSTQGYMCYCPPPYSGKDYSIFFTRGYMSQALKDNKNKDVPELINHEAETRFNFMANSSVLVNKELAIKCGGFTRDPLIKCTDWPLWKKCTEFSDCKFVNIPLFYYNNSKRVQSARIRGSI